MFLDVQMPRMNGFEFLAWLRQHPDLRIIPACIYSSSDNPADVRKAYEAGANSFLARTGMTNAPNPPMSANTA